MSTPLRFSDNEYKNWLKSGLALIHCKDSLHDLVDNEVKKLHADIQQQIVTIHGRHCNSCTWKSIKYRQGRWCISCNNNICDRWLSQILLEHNDQYNHSINWKNADISKWPTDAYEVAKVYMPKGQDQTKNLPQGFDVSAILSLFKYCTWFTKKIPNTAHLVSDLIDIRNELFHSKDFRVADNKKDICINNTIQLLSELCINGNVVSELWKLRLEDIDINYRETEVKAFNTILSAVKDKMDSLLADHIQLSGDLNTAQTTMTSLQAMQTQQEQDMQEIKDKTTQTSGIVDTMATDIKEIKSELEQKRQHFQQMKSFFETNPDIDNQNITKNILEIEKIMYDLQCRVLATEKDIAEIKTRMSSFESRLDRIENKVAEMDEERGKKQPAFDLQKELEHLRAELLSRYKSLRTIPISPFDENEEVFTPDNFYTDVVIKYEDKERKIQEQDQSPVSYKDLFEARQRIILTGVAGSGKSTYCRKHVITWYNLQEDKKRAAGKDGAGLSTHDSLDEDLLKFDLLFYIYSPVISNETNVVELLCNQCIQRELKRDKAEIQEKVSKFLSDHPEKILIIFDGLDELEKPPEFLEKLFKRCLYPRVTVLMGMRRWQISRLGLKATSHYDLLLDIQGFSPDNALKFVEKVIDLDNDMYGQTKSIDIYSHEEIILSFKNIPLLLLFLAHILYMNQSLPDKRRNLYNQILSCLIERCLRKSGDNYFEPRKIQENIDHCSEMFREKYLNSACKVAHHFLLTREGGVSVVIPEKELTQELGDDANMKLSALLDCGIISKEDFFSPLKKTISVTFLHTSFQEYLASIHLVQNEDAFQSFLQSLKTLNDVLRHENLFIFVCGLNAGQGHKAFSRICQVCDLDPCVLKYRQGKDDDDGGGGGNSFYFRVRDDIESLNEMYKTCMNEMDTHDPLEIPDIFAQDDEWYKLVMSRQSSCYVKSLNLTWSEKSHCVLDLSSLTYLISITLCNLSLSEEQSRSLCNFTHLHKLELYDITLTDGILDLSNLHDLTSLKLSSLDISERLSSSLIRTISACTKLEKLELNEIPLHDCVLDLHTLTCLISIRLGHLIVSEENRLQCCSISGIAQLEKLEKLDLLGMKLCMRQHDGLPEPSRLMRLKYIRMVGVTMCEKCSISLCSIISRCSHLTSLELDDVALHDGIIDLRDLTNLTFLSLLQVSMSEGCSRFLKSSISNCTCLKSLTLWYITLHDGIFDLNSLTQLTSLELQSVNMSDECSRRLCLCISTGFFAHLKRLHMKHITLHGVFDLTTMASLTDLKLIRLTMSGECTKSLCNSINACTNLEKLELHTFSLHETVLDLKKFRNLSFLELIDVTMSNECRKVLNESNRHCPKLEHIRVMTLIHLDN